MLYPICNEEDYLIISTVWGKKVDPSFPSYPKRKSEWITDLNFKRTKENQILKVVEESLGAVIHNLGPAYTSKQLI